MDSTTDGQPTPEQRAAFRFPVTSLEQEATLKLGWSEVPIRLINESAGGLAAQVDRLPNVRVDDVVRVRTSAGQIEARIAHITSERRPAGQTYRIGLERLAEKDSWEAERRHFGLLSRLQPARLIPSPTVLLVMLTLAVLVGMVSPIAAFVSVLYFDPPLARRTLEWGLRRVAEVPYEPTLGLSTNPYARQFPVLGHLPESSALLSSRVGEELALSDAQERKIRQIVQTTNDALRQIDRQDKSSHRFQTRAALCKEARRQILGVLTPTQKTRWKKLRTSGL